MGNTGSQLPDRIVFIADAHLGIGDDSARRAENLAGFLRWLKGRISHLYIVGDLFDYWFEYKSVIPSTAPRVVFELYNLKQAGVAVTMFGGNHDYWLGPYLRDSVGVTIVSDEAVVEHQGLSLYIHHGDGLYPRDYGYKLLKKVLRSRLSIFLYRLIHPDLASRIARLTSKTSRKYLAPPAGNDFSEARSIRLFRDIADARLRDGYDAVVYGHCHVPLVEKRHGGTLILLGDWITHDTYITLENGTFSLNAWHSGRETYNGESV